MVYPELGLLKYMQIYVDQEFMHFLNHLLMLMHLLK